MRKPSHHLMALRDLGERLAPYGAAIAVTDPKRPVALVCPEEAPAIARAVPARRREFAAGRQAARLAMSALGLPDQAVPSRQDRTPHWPTGLVGSISHDASSCIAILGRDAQYRGFGIDVEPDAPLQSDLITEVCGLEELQWLETLPEGRRGLAARRLFCAKEAAFKAQYPLTRQILGFDAVTVEMNAIESAFVARFRDGCAQLPTGTRLAGQVSNAGGHVLALVSIGAHGGMDNADFLPGAIG